MKKPSVTSIRIPVPSALAYLLYISLGLAVGILSIRFIGQHFSRSLTYILGNLIFYSAAVFSHFRFSHGISDWPKLEMGSLGKTLAWGLFMAFVAYLLIRFVGMFWTPDPRGIDDSLHLQPEVIFRGATRYLDRFTALTITGLDLCIVAPIAEEVIFRSGVHRIMKGRFSIPAAAAISATLFSLSHWSVAASAPMFVLGYLCCWIYEKTADIRGPIIMHAGYNLLVSLPLLLGSLQK